MLRQLLKIAGDERNAKWLSPFLLAADALLCALIIWKRPYTEIDWVAYMQQTQTYIKGERNYFNIEGDTGPLVYPGLHVYIHRVLHYVTNEGQSIFTAQIIFAGVYLAALAVVFACYRNVKAPPYVYPLLVLSIRLHSIFLLRLFNDCFAVLFLWLGIYSYQQSSWYVGTMFMSCGLGVKMSVLLVFPAVFAIWPQALGLDGSITQLLIVLQTQGLFAYEFVRAHWRAYVFRAFELSRVFRYKWTVNWRFVPEELFLSRRFAVGLLATHLSILLIFASTRWTKPAGRNLFNTVKLYLGKPDWRVSEAIAERVTPDFVMATILSANVAGMLCARTLHYQFYSWIAWATPYLLWRSGLHALAIFPVWAAQEWAWMQFPSTDFSSSVVVGCLLIQTVGIWWGMRNDPDAILRQKDRRRPVKKRD